MRNIPQVAQSKSVTLHFSPNGHLLAWVRPPLDKPIITVELYTKWYGLQILYPDGVVEDIGFPQRGFEPITDSEILTESDHYYEPTEGDVGDHVVNPKTVILYAHLTDRYIDELALNLIAGRWATELKDEFRKVWNHCAVEVV